MHKQVERLLPFKVGQLAEARSFDKGFRSAWFRCKIKEIACRNENPDYGLEFYDFPDDKMKWTRIYQIPPIDRRRGTNTKKMLMVRPQYPPICYESEVAHANTIREVTVVKNGVWKVGDLVDWCFDDCYWSGRVTQILGDDKVQIELPLPPIGEGLSYEALCKDLRPSLDWSPEHGWSVLTSQEEEEENYRPCARLITPLDQGLPNGRVVPVDKSQQSIVKGSNIKNVWATAGSMLGAPFLSPISANALLPLDKQQQSREKKSNIKNVVPTAGSMLDAPFLSPRSANALLPVDKSQQSIPKEPNRQPLRIAISKEETHMPQPNTELDRGDGAIGKTALSRKIGSVEGAGNSSGEDQCYSSGTSKKIRTNGNISMNFMRSDTIEAPIADLEELVNKVKWLKGILESGVPLSNAGRPPWKFVEDHA